MVGGIGSTQNFLLPNTLDLTLLLLLGVFGFFGQYFMTKAFQQGEASKVAPFKYVEVIFTLSFGVYLFDEVYTFQSLLGIAMVISGLTASVLYKERKSRALKG